MLYNSRHCPAGTAIVVLVPVTVAAIYEYSLLIQALLRFRV